MRERILAGIDIGTHKVAVLIAEVNNYGDIHLIGIAERKSRGIQKGAVSTLGAAARAISSAVSEAENMAGKKIDTVVINISGEGLKSQNERDTRSLSPSAIEVEEEHVQELINRCVVKAKEDNYEIIHSIPRKFKIDDKYDVESPHNMEASKLEAQVHIVKIPGTLSRNIRRAVTTAGLNPSMIVVNAIASAKAVLKDEEREEGVLLLDIGAGLTDFVLFSEKAPIITGCIPYGGLHITKDISHYMKVNIEEAERVKQEHGVAYVELVRDSEVIRIKPRGEEREITANKTQLAEVIQVRLEEILELVDSYLKKENVNVDEIAKAGVVITGGTALMKGIRELAEAYFDLPVRIGMPLGVKGLKERIENPIFSTAYGLLEFWKNPEGIVKKETEVRLNSKGWFNSLLEKFKQVIKDIS
jgi:cell division protein FtsA